MSEAGPRTCKRASCVRSLNCSAPKTTLRPSSEGLVRGSASFCALNPKGDAEAGRRVRRRRFSRAGCRTPPEIRVQSIISIGRGVAPDRLQRQR
eukprot:15481333-Alexandrium_andersonii.AAC.1